VSEEIRMSRAKSKIEQERVDLLKQINNQGERLEKVSEAQAKALNQRLRALLADVVREAQMG
jgi:hypothetical protein